MHRVDREEALRYCPAASVIDAIPIGPVPRKAKFH